MKIKMLNGIANVGGDVVPADTPFDLENKEAQGLIDRGLAVEVKSNGDAKSPATEPEPVKPPADVLKRAHQGIEEVTKAEQLPNKQSQK